MNLRIGKISKFLFMNYSYCKKCETTWNLVKPHNVMYSSQRGCFHLCEKCWNESDQMDRLLYYTSNTHNNLTNDEMNTLKRNIASS